MRALVFGTTGQVARELAASASAFGIQITPLGREQADLTDADACAEAIAAYPAEVVINAAAYTAVDLAEDQPELAHAVNAVTPGAMAGAAKAAGVPFLHISTDYVFDGRPGRPWREEDPTAPLGVYGESKLAGEQAVAAAGGDHVILRTAWVFSSHGKNFVKTMLTHGRDREEMRVVGDQWGGPTAASDIAGALWTIAQAWSEGRGRSGIYHFAGAPATNWAGFAETIFARSGWERTPRVAAIATTDWPTKAMRPANSVLDCGKILEDYGIGQPDWPAALNSVLSELQKVTK